MAQSIDALVTRFDADIQKFEDKMRRMDRVLAQTAANAKRQHEAAARSVNQAWNKVDVGPAMARMAGALAGAFSIQAATNLADAYTRFTNSLKVTGLEGEKLAAVQDHLFETAKKNGLAVESLGQLYGRTASAAKDLGMNQAQMLKMTDTVALALKAQGSSAEQSSGALLQLAQALGSQNIQAEEYNSLLDGMPALLQAIADSTDKYKGSVAKLTADVKAGKVSNKEFSDMILRASELLETRAAKATTTFGQALESLRTSLTQYIGEADASLGVTERLAGAIEMLANNLDEVATVIGIVGGIMATRLVAGFVSTRGAALLATVQTQLLAAGLAGMTTSAAAATAGMTALRGAMAFFGGPIGVAILAVTAAIAGLSYVSKDAERDAQKLVDTYGGAKPVFDALKKSTEALATATDKERKAAIEAAKAKRDQAQAHLKAAEAKLQEAKASLALLQAENLKKVHSGTLDPEGAYGQMAYMGARESRAQSQVDARQRIVDNIKKDIADATATIEAASRPVRLGGGSGGKGGGKSGGSGRSAADVARASEDAIARAQVEELQAAIANADTAEERHALQNQLLNLEYNQKLEAIRRQVKEGEITKIAGQRLEEYAKLVWMDQTETADKERKREIEQQAQELADTRLRVEQDMFRMEEDRLLDMARMADNTEERINYELQALELREKADAAQFEADQKVLAATLKKLEVTEAEIAEILARREGAFKAGQKTRGDAEREDIASQRNGWEDWLKDRQMDAAELNAEFQKIADQGLGSLADAITDVMMGTKSLGDAFKEMATQIIADILRMTIRMLIFRALASAFGMGGGGGMGPMAPVISGAPMSLQPTGFFASGTDYARGGLSIVGEGGPEAVWLPRGSQVLPNNLLRHAAKAVPQGGGGGGNFIDASITVHANDAVLASQLEAKMAQAMAMQEAKLRRAIPQEMQRSSNKRFLR